MADTTTNDRPSPEALLEEANRERRGRLKIFLGSAPGVGKTFAMLEDGQARRREGVDMVVGVVETHGRRETEVLLEGLAIQPRRMIDYRGRAFAEMDVEALLARRPRLALVDELAHTNIPGSRHPKRWQDVEELLDAGVDVYSTLNVQHLESLNDVVERITGIAVRETLPDSVLHKADEIELIDLPPKELIRRLEEGKVYVPEQAQRAVSNFFSPGNLTALREMALRQAAERVDAQMLRYMRAHAIVGPWPARERILVCISEGAQALRLVRTAKRAAERRQVPWIAVYVETYRHQALSEADKDCISQALRLAEQLGAETTILQGDGIGAEILGFASNRNVTQIIVGRGRRRRWLPGRHSPVIRDLLARGEGFDVLVVAGEDERPPPLVETRPRRKPAPWSGFAAAIGAVAAATLVASPIYSTLPGANVSLAYLLGVLLVAIRFGLLPSIAASVLSFIVYNFVFTEPRFTFAMSDTQGILIMVFFLVVAVLVSKLAARVRTEVEASKRSARRMATLYEFTSRISAAASLDDVLWAVVHHVAATLHGRSLVLLPEDGRLVLKAGYPPEDTLDEKSQAAADWAWSNGKPAGRGSATLPTTDWLFLPLRAGRNPVGVLGVQVEANQTLLSPEQSRLLDTLADQAAAAIDRTTLVAGIEKARVTAETERLRSAMLSSLSHDLRTPLVSILGASSSLASYDRTLKPAERMELIQTIQDEAERLNRFVQNLLDMTRIGAGALRPRTDWVDLRDVVGAALARAQKMLRDRPVKLEIDPELPLMCLDAVLMEQVFFNLIDNACKYSPEGTAIAIRAVRQRDSVQIAVCDLGPGIPEADRERVFDMFYRVQAGDKQAAGTGLGLAICRGVIEAHGGTVGARPGPDGHGTCIALVLPAGTPPPVPEALGG